MNRYGWVYQRNRRTLLRFRPRCYRCGRPATTADHIVPLAEGGSHAITNLRPACEQCNKSRGGILGRTRQLARQGRRILPAGPREVWPGAIPED